MAAYTVKDFVTAIRTNDFDAINDIAKKYPVPFAKISAAVALAPDAMADVAELIGDATTGTKMNNMAKAVWGAEGASGADEAEDATEDTAEVEKPAPKRRGRPRKAAAAKIEDLQEQIRTCIQALERIKQANLPTAPTQASQATAAFDFDRDEAPKAAMDSDDIASEIEANLQALVGTTDEPAPKAEPKHPVNETTTSRFANLQFGPNYDPTANK